MGIFCSPVFPEEEDTCQVETDTALIGYHVAIA